MEPEIRDDRQMRALTGVPPEKLELLEAAFAKAFAEEKEKIYQNQIKDGKRQRKPGGGQKGKLPTIREKLILCFTTSRCIQLLTCSVRNLEWRARKLAKIFIFCIQF